MTTIAATIERVRKWAHDWRNEAGVEAFRELDAALDPKPAFVLPTEAGAGIMATFIGGVSREEYELRLFSDGKWYDTAGDSNTPDDLMDPHTWVNHRLLGGAE